MRSPVLLPAVLLAALLPFAGASCGDGEADRPAAAPTTAERVPATTPPATTDATTPPPATEMSAISRDSQAKLTAEGAAAVVAACHATTHDYRRCSTARGSELGTFKAAAWGTEPGPVSLAGNRDGYRLDSRSYSGAHFMIEHTEGGDEHRTCRGSVSECAGGQW